MMRSWVAIALIVVIVMGAFLPALNREFVGWDDNVMVFDNPLIRQLDPRSVFSLFSRFYYAPYVPLVLLSYSLEYHFFRLDAFFYHLANLLLHVLNVLLVFALLARLGLSGGAALVGALLFGVHPLRVESVAWITERKDVLSGLFFLGALLSYLSFLRERRSRWYALSLFLFLCSLLSKPTVAPLALVLVLLDWLEGRKVNRRSIGEKIPFFILALALGVVAIFVQYNPSAAARSTAPASEAGLSDLLVGFTNPAFYLGKFLFPVRLSAFYSYPHPVEWFLPRFYFPVLFVLSLGVVVLFSLRRTKAVFAAFAFSLVMILPVLKLVPFGEDFAQADRYTYLPSIGLSGLIAFGAQRAWRGFGAGGRGRRAILLISGAVMAVCLLSLTWTRCRVWGDTITLFTDVLRRYPRVAVAYANLGTAYGHRKQYEKELQCYRKFLQLRPYKLEIYQNVALAYQQLGDYEKEAECYLRLLGHQGESAKLYNLLGVAYGKLGRYQDAVTMLRRALELDPGEAMVYNNLGLALGFQGLYPEALSCFKRAIELDPDLSEAHANLGMMYESLGERAKASAASERARRLFKVGEE